MKNINKTPLFTSESGSHKIYRIPGMVVSQKGTILTYCEARTGTSDYSGTNILMRRSLDNGETFEEPQIIASCGENESVGNPVMIASKDGTIHFLWESLYKRLFYKYSTDDGVTFSQPTEFSSMFENYRQLGINWNVYAVGPGHGIELKNGRLILPAWISWGKDQEHVPNCVSVIYSNDKGKTWNTGEVVKWYENCYNMNETVAVELSDGNVMLNIRNHGPNFTRATTISENGYSNFSPYKLDSTLIDPICFGSIVKGVVNDKEVIAFANCANKPCEENNFTRLRENLTLRVSLDDAKTWYKSFEIEAKSGYADLAFSNDGKWIYCFYEHNDIESIKATPNYLTFVKINTDLLK